MVDDGLTMEEKMHKHFELKCKKCRARSTYDPEKNALSIKILFRAGTPNIKDRMIVVCNKCGNNIEHGIVWQIE